GPDPAAAADLAETRDRVRAAVDNLPELLRQVILLAYFQGMKYQDIADTLGVPVGTVKSRLHAAVARLNNDWPVDKNDGGDE
ncbi:MAG: sigma-70 family RNA polymerase sigma factor, partial [Gemmataceae bacterium]